MSRTRVLIVDDHAVVRSGLRMLIAAQPDLEVVGEAGSIHEAATIAAKVAPTIITLDLSMPGSSGVTAIERLRAVARDARIIVLTMHDDPAYVRSAIALGASGYVNKSAADSELISAIRAVARGRLFIDAGAGALMSAVLPAGPSGSEARSPVQSLSEREREVLQGVARGYTNQRLADDLGLSVKTVESYRSRLMRKLGLKERADIVRLAIDLGLLTNENPG